MPTLRQLVRERADILALISVGGAIGSLGRWGLGEIASHESGGFAVSTFVVNVSGAFLLGLLMAFMVDVLATTRLVRPFLAIGILGGWTTFSTYMLDTHAMLAAGAVREALVGYLMGTLVVGIVAVWIGLVTGRLLIVAATRRRSGPFAAAPRPGGSTVGREDER